ncbi:MAG TPA: efflux RND transporter periplasmic adaptor subunit [Acidobacteriota bacterium]|nr:efflux RND transporter periplasmic adaptor subunit [Acidobacteriota bacterium]
MKKTGLALLVLAGLAVTAWLLWPVPQASDRISLTGNIEMTEVQVAFKRAGRIEEIRVAEGEPVEAGSLLASLDDEELRQRRREALAALKAASARVDELRAQRAFQQESLESTVEERQSALQAQRSLLQELLSGTRKQEIEEADAALRRARSRLSKAESDYKRAQPLVEHEDISRQQFDQVETAYQTAQAEAEQASQRLDLLREGPRQEDIEAARSRVRQAQAQLRLAQAGSLDIERLSRSIETARAEIERAQARVSQIESQLDDTQALSPIDGVVLLKSGQAGEVVAAGTPILSLGDYARPWMRAYIPENLLGRVKLGSPVQVSTDSYPGKVYRGEITFIASEAEFTPRQVLTPEQRSRLVYRIKISLENPRGELKLNMPCDVEIPLQPARQDLNEEEPAA